jgi:hypothetical protein
MNDTLAIDWYRIAEEQLTAVAAAVQRQDPLDIEALSTLAIGLADAMRHSDQLVVKALGGPAGPPLVTNLINVGILATKVGSGLGYYGKELERLTLAGLVHDIGLFAVPQSLVTKSGRLTPDERTLIEQHPELGYQAIHKLGPKYEWLAQIVRQAHERWNGQGYPNKLKGRQISELAQVIGVVDVFDALVSPRAYRRRFFPHEAVRELMVAERTAFPREVLKALVEQLSAYPLGTSVRLTTGEIGSVIQVNTAFPLRPVVHVTGDPLYGQSRQLDLSQSPLVSIIETLEAPDLARVPVTKEPVRGRSKPSILSGSDQFTSLLESLDAIASAIQGVVESKTEGLESGATAPSREERWASHRLPAQEVVDAGFQKEVIGLFALEAHEWLAQIQSALKQLAQGANGTLRPKLYGVMLHGITNLAKSASTVQLSAIEQMASNLLPILHDVGRQEPHTMVSALGPLQEGLHRITQAVRRLAGEREEPSMIDQEISPQTGGLAPAVVEILSISSTPTVSLPVTGTSGQQLLTALRELQQARSRSMQPARDVLEAVIQRAEPEADRLDVSSVGRILHDLDRLDEEFLDDVRSRVPAIGRVLANLRQTGTTDFLTASQLDPIVEQVEALYDVANRVGASMITMFLQGLRSFLLVAAYRKTATLPQRLETVESRIHALVPMAEQWVNIGRIERSAISDILPA